MNNIKRYTLEQLLAALRLHKAQMEFNSDYTFGFDDVQRIITDEINKLIPMSERPEVGSNSCTKVHGVGMTCKGCESGSVDGLTVEKYDEAMGRLYGVYAGSGKGSENGNKSIVKTKCNGKHPLHHLCLDCGSTAM